MRCLLVLSFEHFTDELLELLILDKRFLMVLIFYWIIVLKCCHFLLVEYTVDRNSKCGVDRYHFVLYL